MRLWRIIVRGNHAASVMKDAYVSVGGCSLVGSLEFARNDVGEDGAFIEIWKVD